MFFGACLEAVPLVQRSTCYQLQHVWMCLTTLLARASNGDFQFETLVSSEAQSSQPSAVLARVVRRGEFGQEDVCTAFGFWSKVNVWRLLLFRQPPECPSEGRCVAQSKLTTTHME